MVSASLQSPRQRLHEPEKSIREGPRQNIRNPPTLQHHPIPDLSNISFAAIGCSNLQLFSSGRLLQDQELTTCLGFLCQHVRGYWRHCYAARQPFLIQLLVDPSRARARRPQTTPCPGIHTEARPLARAVEISPLATVLVVQAFLVPFSRLNQVKPVRLSVQADRSKPSAMRSVLFPDSFPYTSYYTTVATSIAKLILTFHSVRQFEKRSRLISRKRNTSPAELDTAEKRLLEPSSP